MPLKRKAHHQKILDQLVRYKAQNSNFCVEDLWKKIEADGTAVSYGAVRDAVRQLEKEKVVRRIPKSKDSDKKNMYKVIEESIDTYSGPIRTIKITPSEQIINKIYNFRDVINGLAFFKSELDRLDFQPTLALSFNRGGNLIATMYSINKRMSIQNVITIPRDRDHKIIEICKNFDLDIIKNSKIVIFYFAIVTSKSLDVGLRYILQIFFNESIHCTSDCYNVLIKYNIKICTIYITEAALNELKKYKSKDILIHYKIDNNARKKLEEQPWILADYDYY